MIFMVKKNKNMVSGFDVPFQSNELPVDLLTKYDKCARSAGATAWKDRDVPRLLLRC
jgi:hypothetical protein